MSPKQASGMSQSNASNTSTQDTGRRRSEMKVSQNTNATSSLPACDQCRTRKVRCDREHPTCSNCRKANLACDFSNRGKRINHTKQLVEDFSSLSVRLESIDAHIAKITRQLHNGSPSQLPATSDEATKLADSDLKYFFSRKLGDDDTDSVASSRPRHSLTDRISIDRKGHETYQGATSVRALFQITQDAIYQLLDPESDRLADIESAVSIPLDMETWQDAGAFVQENAEIRSQLQERLDAFPYPLVSEALVMSGDGKLVGRPPQTFLEPAVTFFLEEINPVYRLFDEDTLKEAVADEYDSTKTLQAGADAWSLVFNNIIVMVMGLKLRAARSSKVYRQDLDEDIFQPFLANTRRAFDALDKYNEPRLINVQALITLALVAADHFPYGTFEKVIHRACLLAREMGLAYSVEPQHEVEAVVPSESERRRVFWLLYSLDKKRAFLTGQPCDLYLFESDLETLPEDETGDLYSKFDRAKTHMMSLWEEIWMGLYSSRSLRNAGRYRDEQVVRLANHHRDWVILHRPLLCRVDQEELDVIACSRYELRYSFHTAQILIQRCSGQSNGRRLQLSHARAALRVVQEIHKKPVSVASVFLLSRLFRSFPIIAFHVLNLHTFTGVESENVPDIELLSSALEAIKSIGNPQTPQAYFNRLHLGMSWCMSVATTVGQILPPSLPTTHCSRVSSTYESSMAGTKRGSICLEDVDYGSEKSRRQRLDHPNTDHQINNVDPFQPFDASHTQLPFHEYSHQPEMPQFNYASAVPQAPLPTQHMMTHLDNTNNISPNFNLQADPLTGVQPNYDHALHNFFNMPDFTAGHQQDQRLHAVASTVGSRSSADSSTAYSPVTAASSSNTVSPRQTKRRTLPGGVTAPSSSPSPLTTRGVSLGGMPSDFVQGDANASYDHAFDADLLDDLLKTPSKKIGGSHVDEAQIAWPTHDKLDDGLDFDGLDNIMSMNV